MTEPGGGGPKLSKLPVEVLEQVPTVLPSLFSKESSEFDEYDVVLRESDGGPKRESEEEVVLKSSGVLTSVINAGESICQFCSMIRSMMFISRLRCCCRSCRQATRCRHRAAFLLLMCFCRVKLLVVCSVGAAEGVGEQLKVS
jgi:hypothetical protein